MPVDICIEKVDLFVSARGLPRVTTFSNTDPYAVLYVLERHTNKLKVLGTTDLIRDTQNPDWTAPLNINFLFETVQEIVVKVFHHDGKHTMEDTEHQTLVGEAHFLLSALVRAPSTKLSIPLTSGLHTGTVEVRAELPVNSRDLFVATFAGDKLINKDGFFGKSDPFFTASRLNEDGTWTSVFKSHRIDNNLSPRWGQLKILTTVLCNGDLDRPLRFEVWDFDPDGKHDSMGVSETSVRALLAGNGHPLNVVEADKKKASKSYVNSGTFTVSGAVIEPHPTFSQYLSSGLDISLTVALDFTGSNGDPTLPSSLHFHHPAPTLNPYQLAIRAVGNILEQYDTDKSYSVMGFGARTRQPDGSFGAAAHCFPVGEGVRGVDGILQAYEHALPTVMLSGPTLFGPMINHASAVARGLNCSQAAPRYSVLLIITDGTINDFEATKAAIADAQNQPVSIIIVGVGAEDFKEMAELDNFRTLGQRDITQFVSFNEQMARGGSSALAESVLSEMPDQIVQYLEGHHILPAGKK